MARTAVALASWLTACGPPADPGYLSQRTVDAGQPGIQAYDLNRVPQPLDALPHWPLLALTGFGIREADAPAVWLLRGPPDPDLLADLDRRPLSRAHADLAVPTSLETHADVAWLVADAPLSPGQAYTLALAAWLGEEAPRTPIPLAIEMRASDANGGATLIASLPAAGQASVSPGVAEMLLAFAGRPAGCAALGLSANGLPMPIEPRVTSCDAVHSAADTCCALAFKAPLDAGTRYVVSLASLRDVHGGPAVGGPVDFVTGDAPADDATGPRLRPISCALDERRAGADICNLVSEQAAHLRLRTDEPVRAVLSHGQTTRSWLIGRDEAILEWPDLEPACEHDFALQLIDARGLSATSEIRLETSAALATVTIAEVRADPLGPEPDQEFVELWNFGRLMVDLSGFSLSDTRDTVGVTLPPGATLAPSERALLVADGFDPHDPLDVAPPPGTQLIRVGPSLANKGLANAGEPLFLRDREGQRISAAPATPKPQPGTCSTRVSGGIRSGNPGTFALDDTWGCTPGR